MSAQAVMDRMTLSCHAAPGS